jgi:hypothetical protein
MNIENPTTPTNSDGVLAIDNNTQAGTTVGDGTTERVLVGFQKDGFGVGQDYGIKVSQDGFDVKTATDEQLVMSSAFNMFKIVQTDTVTVGELEVDTTSAAPIIASTSLDISYPVGTSDPIVLAFLNSEDTLGVQNPTPSTIANDSTIGSIDWVDITNAYVYPAGVGTYSSVQLDGAYVSGGVVESSIKIVKADGSLSGTDLSTGATITDTFTEYTYGDSSELWGEMWTPADINDTDFGAVISYQAENLGNISHYLKVSGLGFNIPTDATITGIKVNVHAWYDNTTFVGQLYAYLAGYRLTVYYTLPSTSSIWQSTVLYYDEASLSNATGFTVKAELKKSLTATSGLLTLKAQVRHAPTSIGLASFGGWSVRYYVLQETSE